MPTASRPKRPWASPAAAASISPISTVVEEKGRRYVTAVIKEEGRPTAEVLAENLPDLIAGLKFEKSMRWNESGISYSRPLRWFVALFGADVIPFSYAGIPSGRTSRGLRPYDSPEITISDAGAYQAAMRENKIVLATDERRQLISERAAAIAAENMGTIPGRCRSSGRSDQPRRVADSLPRPF